MKAELIFTNELIDQIADRIIERLTRVLADYVQNGSEDVLLTPDEVADFLKVKRSQIYAWVSESKYSDNGIPFRKAGKFLRFSKKAVMKWIKTRENGIALG